MDRTSDLFGAGPSGMILIQLLPSGGATRVTVAAPTAFKLEFAHVLGADETVQIPRDDPEGNQRRLRDLAPDGFYAAVDATGAVSVLDRCVALTRVGFGVP